MKEMKEITLESGRKLRISPAPFPLAKNLYQAVTEELKIVSLDPQAQVDVNFYKNLFCSGLSSKRIDSALAECLKRALYEGGPITEDTWEPVAAREDYLQVCFEVAKENLLPFTKSLYAKYYHILEMLKVNLRA